MKQVIDLSDGQVLKSRGSAAVKYDIYQTQLHRLMKKDDFFIMIHDDFKKLNNEEQSKLLEKHRGINGIEFIKYKPTVTPKTTIKELNNKLDRILELLEK